MTLVNLLFYFFGGIAIASGLALLFVKNIFHAALSFLACVLSIAALFIFMYAEFLAVAQILLYAGGVVVLLIFGIMLTSKSGNQPIPITNNGTLMGLSVGIATFFLLCFEVKKNIFTVTPSTLPDGANSIKTIGIELLTDYSLPFEMTGVLLLGVLVGAATLAGFKKIRN